MLNICLYADIRTSCKSCVRRKDEQGQGYHYVQHYSYFIPKRYGYRSLEILTQHVWVPFSGNTYTKRMGAVFWKHFGRKTRTVSITYKLSKKCSRLERYNRSCRVRIEISNIYRTSFSSKVSSYNRTCRIWMCARAPCCVDVLIHSTFIRVRLQK